MTCIAIIPARGGSKSVPRKNVLPLAGKPLIAHTIAAAQASTRIDRVVVSTDDLEIRQIALQYGAEVIVRPPELATDEASSESALLHAIDELEAASGDIPEIVVFLQCTSPFTRAADIDALLESMEVQSGDSAFSAVPFHGFLWKYEQEDPIGVNHDKSERLRRQDREKEYLEDGAIYAFRTEGFRTAKHRFFGNTIIHPVDPANALEIDEPSDLERAAAHFEITKTRPFSLPERIEAIAFDFDGVFTDDRVLLTETGEEAAMCSRRDGMGISQLHKLGIPMVVISKERVPIVEHRCRKLKLEVQHGIDAKLPQLQAWLEARDISPANAIYIGNDINDLECMAFVGCSVAPADAHPSARGAASFVLTTSGGKGAVRELADLVCEHRSTSGTSR